LFCAININFRGLVLASGPFKQWTKWTSSPCCISISPSKSPQPLESEVDGVEAHTWPPRPVTGGRQASRSLRALQLIEGLSMDPVEIAVSGIRDDIKWFRYPRLQLRRMKLKQWTETADSHSDPMAILELLPLLWECHMVSCFSERFSLTSLGLVHTFQLANLS
jgi:hypothetical protein